LIHGTHCPFFGLMPSLERSVGREARGVELAAA
jgi:hypothetical protein